MRCLERIMIKGMDNEKIVDGLVFYYYAIVEYGKIYCGINTVGNQSDVHELGIIDR